MKIEKKERKKKKNNKFINKIKLSLKKILKKINFFEKEEKATYSLKEVVIIMLFSLGLGFFACFSFVKIFQMVESIKLYQKT